MQFNELNLRNTLDNTLESVYKTPHRVSSLVFILAHTALIGTQLGMGNNYLSNKYDQFTTNPILTTLEVSVPYVVTYVVNSVGRYVARKKNEI